MMQRAIHLVLVACMLVLVTTSVGCMRVKPWQRADLARKDMQFDPDPHRTALQSHIQFSKEASMPGTSAGGGGCGCN